MTSEPYRGTGDPFESGLDLAFDGLERALASRGWASS